MHERYIKHLGLGVAVAVDEVCSMHHDAKPGLVLDNKRLWTQQNDIVWRSPHSMPVSHPCLIPGPGF